MRATPVGIAFGIPGQTYYAPLNVPVEGGDDEGLFAAKDGVGQGIPPGEALEALRPLLQDPAVPKWCADVKRMRTVLRRFGGDVVGAAVDVSLASYLLNPDGNHTVADAASRHLDRYVATWRQRLRDAGEGRRAAVMGALPTETLAQFAAEDLDAVAELAPHLHTRLQEDDLLELYE